MKFNKKILLIFLVLVFASISCVAASDADQISDADNAPITTISNDNVEIKDSNEIDDVASDDLASKKNSDVVVDDGRDGADLKKYSLSSKIYSNNKISTTYTDNSNDVNFTNLQNNITQKHNYTVSNKNNFNITGQNNKTVDANHTNNIYVTFNNSNGTIKDVNFKNFNWSAVSLVNNSNVTFTNCNFTDNFISGGSGLEGGAAVFITKNSTGTFINCNFVNNNAISRASGGAVYISKGGKGNFTNCNFTNNSVKSFLFGGAVAIFSDDQNISKGFFKNCNFTGNKVNSPSSNFGGAIFYNTGNRTLNNTNNTKIENCVFKNNYAGSPNGGGAAYFYKNETMDNNVAVNNQNDVNNSNISDIFTNCTFTNNSDGQYKQENTKKTESDKQIKEALQNLGMSGPEIFEESASQKSAADQKAENDKIVKEELELTDAAQEKGKAAKKNADAARKSINNKINSLKSAQTYDYITEYQKSLNDALNTLNQALTTAKEAENEAKNHLAAMKEAWDKSNKKNGYYNWGVSRVDDAQSYVKDISKMLEDIKPAVDEANKDADEKLKNPYINDTRYQNWRSAFVAFKGRNPTVEEYESYLKSLGSTASQDTNKQTSSVSESKNPTVSESTSGSSGVDVSGTEGSGKHQTGIPSGSSSATDMPVVSEGSQKAPTTQTDSSVSSDSSVDVPSVQPGAVENPSIEEPTTPTTPSVSGSVNSPSVDEIPGVEELPKVDVQDTAKNVVDSLLGYDTNTNANNNVVETVPSGSTSSSGSSSKVDSVSDNSILNDFISESKGESSSAHQAHTVDEIVEAQSVRDALKEEIEKRQQEGSLSDEEIQDLNQKVEVLDQKISQAQSALVVNVPVVDMFYKDGSKFTVSVVEGNAPAVDKEVTIIINGQKYVKRTDANGQISMNLNLDPGLYDVVVYVGSESENAIKSSITINSTIEGSDLSLFYRNGSRYEAKFLNKDGSPLAFSDVVFNINGVFYNRMTDADGVASIGINLAPGEYIITATNPVNNQQYSNLVVVKSVIQSTDLTKYYGESGAYEAKILDNNGDPLVNANVKLNIHGVFYDRVTDANGIAHLNINLLPGSYVITAFVNVNGGTAALSNKINVLP